MLVLRVADREPAFRVLQCASHFDGATVTRIDTEKLTEVTLFVANDIWKAEGGIMQPVRTSARANPKAAPRRSEALSSVVK